MMIHLLCRNRVADFAHWKAVFDSHGAAHRDTGLRLIRLWRSLEEPNNVFFLFEVDSIEKARKFISDPEAAETGRAAGVIDGELHFVQEEDGEAAPIAPQQELHADRDRKLEAARKQRQGRRRQTA